MTCKLLPVFSVATIALALSAGPIRANDLDPVPIAPPSEGGTSFAATDALAPVGRTFLATHPLFRYRGVRAQNILSAPGTLRDTTVQNASVSLRWNLGQYWALRYMPMWTLYSDDAFDDNVGHDASLQFRRGFVDWNFRGSHDYRRNSLPRIETGRQTEQETHFTSFRAQRPIGPRTRLDLGLSHEQRSTPDFASYRTWATDDWLHLQLSPWVTPSAGFSYGYVTVDGSPNMSYGQVRGRIRWHVSEKIDLDVHGGIESRKFVDSEASSARTPVYGATVMYRPLDTTSVGVTADRAVYPSYFQMEVTRIGTWQLSVTQRFLERFDLSASFVRRTASHRSSTDTTAPLRRDQGRSFGLRLSTSLFAKVDVAAVYQYRRNRSSASGFDSAGNVFGGEVSIQF